MNNSKPLKLLIVDDAELPREVLCEQLRLLGHEAFTAENGEQAVARYFDINPDVVIMDWVMPVLDGIAATRAIRALPGARWVPIIMLSAYGDEIEIVSALRHGCDDYLVKPIKLPVLNAKIQALQRIAAMQQQIEQSQHELQLFYANAEEELKLAKHIMTRLVRRKDDEPSADAIANYWSQPASTVSGDIILTALENGISYTMLADATGHGLAAAITLIPIVNVFYAMTAKGFSVATMVEEMNRQVRTYCPVERFVALTLVGVNINESTIEVWNGGIPPLLLLNANGDEVRRFKSRFLPLGILADEKFKSEPEFFHYEQPLQLIAFSDGLIEAGGDECFGFERVHAAIASALPAQRLRAVQDELQKFLGDEKHHDDISFAVIECPMPQIAEEKNNPPIRSSASIAQSDWSIQATFSAQQLKTIDFAPMMVNWAQAMGLSRDFASTFFLVITELFVNALEHGLLELASSVKRETNGFERFMELRQQRLQALTEGQIHVAIFSRQSDEGGVLAIHMRDSGKGFSESLHAASDLADNRTLSGRGIALVRKFCRSVEYRGCGNDVYAELLF